MILKQQRLFIWEKAGLGFARTFNYKPAKFRICKPRIAVWNGYYNYLGDFDKYELLACEWFGVFIVVMKRRMNKSEGGLELR